MFLGKLQWPKNETRILGASKIFVVDFKGLENILSFISKENQPPGKNLTMLKIHAMH